MHLLPRLPLSPGDPLPSLAAPLRDAFATAAAFPLREYRAEAGTTTGTVRAGWSGSFLCLLADLEKRAPATLSTADHQPLWRLGDCLEIFFKGPDGPSYYEFHVSPAGHMLALQFPTVRTGAEQRGGAAGVIERHGMPGKRFESVAAVRPDRNGWTVFARIDLAALGIAKGSLEGARLAFSVCTCNFMQKGCYYQASTSELKIVDVHLHDQWRQAECVG